MNTIISRTTKWIALLVALTCGSAFAGDPWTARIEESATANRAGDYNRSAKIMDTTLADMVQRLGGGAAPNQLFAAALVQKALASAGLGDLDEALWHFHVAAEISPEVMKSDLAAFGAPGEFLTRHAARQFAVTPTTSVPRVIHQVTPKFPAGASRFGITGDLVVEIVVDPSGQPTLPRIVHALPSPALSFVALEALRQWRFQPATNNGQAVPAVFDLTVHYKL